MLRLPDWVQVADPPAWSQVYWVQIAGSLAWLLVYWVQVVGSLVWPQIWVHSSVWSEVEWGEVLQ